MRTGNERRLYHTAYHTQVGLVDQRNSTSCKDWRLRRGSNAQPSA